MRTRTTMQAATRGSLMDSGQVPGRHYAMLILALALVGCGPGNVAPGDDDASGDDDAVAGDDDLVGDDDAATGGTGTISVTVEVLAVLSEGQTVEPEIVVALAPFSDFIEEVAINGTTVSFREASDGIATGRTPPADIVVTAGQRYVVALKANEPDAPVEQRFVAAPHEVAVERDGTAVCGMFLGRDLGGEWRQEEPEAGAGEVYGVSMFHMEQINPYVLPCLARIWAGGLGGPGPLCFLDGDRIWQEQPDIGGVINGSILNHGTRMEIDSSAEIDPQDVWHWTFVRLLD